MANVQLSATLTDALKAVEEEAADPILHGTYVYEHDKTLLGARAVEESSAFGTEKPEGKIFYKVLDDVIAPRYFKDTEDSGTITVRYVVREVNPTTVSVRVDAVFVESARRAVHPSDGAVESAEFGEVQERLNRIQEREKEALEDASEEAKQEAAANQPGPQALAQSPEPARPTQATIPATAAPALPLPPSPRNSGTTSGPDLLPGSISPPGSISELEQRIDRLRHQVEARVKESGAPLKSAPFHTATTIQSVAAGSEVAIVILTTYWYGVQTVDGHTGWIQRSQLEALP